MKNYNKKGFTLIELLVVISIISLLSSVVLASLRTARLKSADANIIQNARQVANLMALEISDSGDYQDLNRGWIDNCAPATAWNSTNHNAKMLELCLAITARTGNISGTTNDLYVGQPQTNNNHRSFTIMARLPHRSFLAGGNNHRYVCIGANGGFSIDNYSPWAGSGCYGDSTNF